MSLTTFPLPFHLILLWLPWVEPPLWLHPSLISNKWWWLWIILQILPYTEAKNQHTGFESLLANLLISKWWFRRNSHRGSFTWVKDVLTKQGNFKPLPKRKKKIPLSPTERSSSSEQCMPSIFIQIFFKKTFLRHPMGNCSGFSLDAAWHGNPMSPRALLGFPGSSGGSARWERAQAKPLCFSPRINSKFMGRNRKTGMELAVLSPCLLSVLLWCREMNSAG